MWFTGHSGRARGPVSLVAIGRPDLDDLGRNFPLLANKILEFGPHHRCETEMVLEAPYSNKEKEPES